MSDPEKDGSDDSDEPPKLGDAQNTEVTTSLSTSRASLDNPPSRTNEIPTITQTNLLNSVPPSDEITIRYNNLNVPPSATSLEGASISDDQLTRQTPVSNIARFYNEDFAPHNYNSRRGSNFDPLNSYEIDEPPIITLFRTGNSFDYEDNSAVSLYSPPHSLPISVLGPTLAEPERPRRASSNWNATLNRLTAAVSKDDRNIARKVYVGDSSSEDSETGSHTHVKQPINPTALRRLLGSAPGKSNLSTKLYLAPNSPFYYMYRPFRRPPLAPVDQSPVITSSKHELPLHYPYSFPTVDVKSYEWINIPRNSDTFVAVKQWTNPEPSPIEAILPADADPLVLYKMERKGIGAGDQIKMKDMRRLQRNITLGQTLSGRKIDGFGSSDEEWIYTRVRCKDEPDFDLLHHLDFGQEGKWPNPYFFYWNWRQLKDGVDENYKKDPSTLNTTRAKIAEELEKSPKIIPYYKLNANDTESSDPEDPTVPHVTDPGNPYSLRWKFNEVREAVIDPVERRYPYLYLHLQSNFYNRYYGCKRALHAIKRCWISTLLGFWNRRRAPWIPYPIWYLIWKLVIRPAIQTIPRKWKFLSENECDTIFYGTLATLYQTQCITEYDILPTMMDPVEVSQIALERALK
ncbi:unnamed protein product [Orchesella dallaii]|uniref:Uncharacterized protein n=1 Tax=Orchesella dallaii TaxID=48710 RepID=A0ABP1S3C6_9HEXA